MWWDVLLALVSVAVIAWAIGNGDDFTDRNTMPKMWDKVFGIALILLVVEATRRTTGWVMPIIIGAFLAYAPVNSLDLLGLGLFALVFVLQFVRARVAAPA